MLELCVAAVPEAMICVPPTVMPVTEVAPLPLSVIVVVTTPGPLLTIGVCPAKELGPERVTVLLEAVAVKPLMLTFDATAVARDEDEVNAAVAALMIGSPLTVIPETIVLCDPENATVPVASPVLVTTGVNPAAEKGP